MTAGQARTRFCSQASWLGLRLGELTSQESQPSPGPARLGTRSRGRAAQDSVDPLWQQGVGRLSTERPS